MDMKRDKIIMVRVTEKEKEQVEKFAKSQHTTVAAMARQLMLKVSANG